MTKYLTLGEVLFIHEQGIRTYGGADGVRDFGLIESALFRPQTGYYADLIEEAAAIWESLSQNHPFVDGNKRVAFATMHTFLIINGYELRAAPDATIRDVLGMYERGEFRFEMLVEWLRRHAVFVS
ncbi:type II toxin-antitoxin system death-on-curing family toxin [Aphanothece stagnina]|uniref:type II toxin-antitoxin system death-on-curing family toxin n=1 Tax=Aphanothece stagnina TaxID=1004305 RepID=UPI00398E939B